jgi:hypothetical protein
MKEIFSTKTRNQEGTKMILSPFRVFACPVKPFFLFNRGPLVLSWFIFPFLVSVYPR